MKITVTVEDDFGWKYSYNVPLSRYDQIFWDRRSTCQSIAERAVEAIENHKPYILQHVGIGPTNRHKALTHHG